jgi:hypothetical protein
LVQGWLSQAPVPGALAHGLFSSGLTQYFVAFHTAAAPGVSGHGKTILL